MNIGTELTKEFVAKNKNKRFYISSECAFLFLRCVHGYGIERTSAKRLSTDNYSEISSDDIIVSVNSHLFTNDIIARHLLNNNFDHKYCQVCSLGILRN